MLFCPQNFHFCLASSDVWGVLMVLKLQFYVHMLKI